MVPRPYTGHFGSLRSFLSSPSLDIDIEVQRKMKEERGAARDGTTMCKSWDEHARGGGT